MRQALPESDGLTLCVIIITMLNFTTLTLNDIDRVRPFFADPKSIHCDATVGGVFLWRDYFSTEYALSGGALFLKVKPPYMNGADAFYPPLGGCRTDGLQKIAAHCKTAKIPSVFFMVSGEDLEVITKLFGEARVAQEDGWSDYIYRAEDLSMLPGRKYHGQKNHINFFIKTQKDYLYEEITPDNSYEVRDFYRNIPGRKESGLISAERGKVLEVLENYRTYGLIGGVLRAEGRPVAFAVGERSKNVLYVHIEKADARVRGAYQMICREFVRHCASEGIEYINREEDEGDPGLRQSKLSCHPCQISKKYIAVVE